MKLSTLFIFLMIFTLSCKKKESKNNAVKQVINPLAIKVNKKAARLYFRNPNNRDSLLKADKLIDSALKMDSLYVFIVNKINVNVLLGRRLESLKWCDELIREKKLGFYPFFYKANIYQKLDNNKMAELNYLKAISILEKQNPLTCNNVLFLLQIALLRDNKTDIYNLLEKYKKLNCSDVNDMDSYVKNFKKEQILINY